MKRLGFWGLGLLCLFRAGGAVAESNYAARCQQVIGVPVPDVDCSNPGGNEVSVGAQGHGADAGKCENPSYGLSGCVRGTRMLRYDDTIERNGRTEKITTYVMCRKTGNNAAKRDQYDDIGIIQYNETKNATCWFSSTGDNVPKKKFGNRLGYPSPSTREGEDFWGAQPASNCVSCHQAGVFLRTPFAASVPKQEGKGFKRTGGVGAYAVGDGNEIPFKEKFAKRGLSCSVDKPAWNRPNGSDGPISIRINEENWPPRGYTEPPGVGGNVNACTRCHYVGFRTGQNRDSKPSCQMFLSEFQEGRRFGLRSSTGNHFWMPPNGAPTTQAQMNQRFGRALDALKWCCNDENKRSADYASLCNDKFTESSDENEERMLTALKDRGACAVCRDCITEVRAPAPKARWSELPTH